MLSTLRRKSFTLIELVVVISVILIILALALPAVNTMWQQTHVKNANHQISNLLKVARARSEDICNIAYGVLFYVDPDTNQEVAVFIDALTYPIADDETYPDVCHRYRVDTTAGQYIFSMKNFVRIAPYKSINWTSDELLNRDYQSGKQRNFFAIIFARGFRTQVKPFLLYDPDGDDDGLGDITSLPVGDTVGEFGGVMRDIVEDAAEERLMIETDWGFRIYDENVFKELSPDNINLVPYLNYYLSRYGQTVFLEG